MRCHGEGEVEVGTHRDSFGTWETETYRCGGCPDCCRFVRATHPYAFRSGEWAEIIVEHTTHGDHAGWLVRWPDGETDIWRVDDPDAGYEFAAAVPAG